MATTSEISAAARALSSSGGDKDHDGDSH